MANRETTTTGNLRKPGPRHSGNVLESANLVLMMVLLALLALVLIAAL